MHGVMPPWFLTKHHTIHMYEGVDNFMLTLPDSESLTAYQLLSFITAYLTLHRQMPDTKHTLKNTTTSF
jgi:hypothetical protein